MNWLEAMVLGIIQGLTEFLPVSSTGHLYLGRHLFGLDSAGLFLDTILHLGTLAAVITVYGDEIAAICRKPLGKTGRLLIVGTIPAVVAGITWEDMLETISQTGVTIGWEFLITGAVLYGADRMKADGHKGVDDLTYTDALWIGLAQSAAILPAVSRSGMTIAAALWRNMRTSAAATYSFLLSIPAIGGGVLLQGAKLLDGRAEHIPLSSLLIGTAMAGICGYVAVRWMVRILSRGSLKGFAWYVWVLGSLILIIQWSGLF
ncbi:undecaprenyl-diphosphate phosphatase [Polycladomyces sp. WAk]|uniref:Undecaprenyl-diphosphatase n=1 Tax=Polycladomyces zharkentensis TaxID=2807616 RepID=A0ABS2WLV1_9BACL|nr:undecaprenyl-diphosphate phosphatase [Polycladomyces sp. WAk]MBN2910518.1 undecaprenyl-diphosphate phosphatase [Polycladomyces sp. WAk]